jgi:hypothetical protein
LIEGKKLEEKSAVELKNKTAKETDKEQTLRPLHLQLCTPLALK